MTASPDPYPAPLPVCAPVRVRDLLEGTPAGPVPVLHRGSHAVYVEVGGRCVGLVDALATQVPCAMRTDATGLPEVTSAHLDGGVLHLDGRPLRIGRYVDVSVPRLAATAAGPAPLAADEVARLVGSGDGLTPFGDDVLCGWLAVHRAAGVATPDVDAAVRALAHRTTLLSATLLDCALHGEVIPEFAAWLRALGTSTEQQHTDRLSAVGHTSGLGLLRGARRALAGLSIQMGTAA